MKNEKGILIKDGQNTFNSYIKAIGEMQEPLTALKDAFQNFIPIAGAYTADWMRKLVFGSGLQEIIAIIDQKSEKESPELRFNFRNYHRQNLDQLKNAIDEVKRMADIYLTDKDYPHSLRHMQSLTITSDGLIDVDSDSKRIRPLFDEVLTRPEDIEYYNVVVATAAQLNHLRKESKKRGLNFFGSSYISLFTHSDGEEIKPNLEGLKFKLSLHS